MGHLLGRARALQIASAAGEKSRSDFPNPSPATSVLSIVTLCHGVEDVISGLG